MGKRVPDNEIEDSIQREKKQKRSEEFGICFELLKWALVVSLPYKQVNRDGACFLLFLHFERLAAFDNRLFRNGL